MAGSVRVVRAVLRLRHAGTSELIASLRQHGDAGGERAGLAVSPPSLTLLRVVARLLCGFSGVLRENALAAAALREAGFPAALVVGAEPVPESGRDRRVFTWIEIAGAPVGTHMPAQRYVGELLRFPAS